MPRILRWPDADGFPVSVNLVELFVELAEHINNHIDGEVLGHWIARIKKSLVDEILPKHFD